MRIRQLLAILAILGGSLSTHLRAQEVIFLAIKGDGTASLILDLTSVERTAYIHDGGRAGARGILGEATIEGEPLLEFLHTKGVSRVVFSCSHPHEDHMGAIRELTKSEKILEFNRVAFVDAIAPGERDASGNEVERLQDTFTKAHGEAVAKSKLVTSLDPAINVNRFAELELSSDAVTVRNYKYDPSLVGKDVHDRAIILEVEVTSKSSSKSVTIVDFDDSSEALIKNWAANSSPPDAVVMAHHGSRNNNMAQVLKTLKKGQSHVIFTANKGNQFLHPTPEALESAIEAVGIKNVHVTGSRFGDNIVVTPEGVTRFRTKSTGDVARLINERISQAIETRGDNRASVSKKSRAKADADALLRIARRHGVKVRDASIWANGTGRAGSESATQGPPDATQQPNHRPDPYPGNVPGTRGGCLCVTKRDGVVVSSVPISVGQVCGHEICGDGGRNGQDDEIHRMIREMMRSKNHF